LSKNSQVTLADLEIRYANIRENNPKVKKCSVTGCKNPRDSTPGLGGDTCCAYHRLLFDFWSADVDRDFDSSMKHLANRRARRVAFTRWRTKMGKEALDKIVLEMAAEPINWEC
jgi:hypothetical protein